MSNRVEKCPETSFDIQVTLYIGFSLYEVDIDSIYVIMGIYFPLWRIINLGVYSMLDDIVTIDMKLLSFSVLFRIEIETKIKQ